MNGRMPWIWALVTACGLGACTPEPELAVAPASLMDDVAPLLPDTATGGGVNPALERTPEERRRDRLVAEITEANVARKALELERALAAEVSVLEARLAQHEDAPNE